MKSGVRSSIRHPLFPKLAAVTASGAGPVSTVIIGTFAELTQAAANGACASRAVFAMRHPSASGLSEAERDILWNLFQVPVYALIVDERGRVLAFECEVHEGLHLQEGVVLPGAMDSSLCDCGYPARRLMPEPRGSSNVA
jgi:hypothetical protein